VNWQEIPDWQGACANPVPFDERPSGKCGVRKRLGLRPGQKLQVIEHAGRVEFVPERDIRELKGFVKGIKTDFLREGDRL
jgi:hypothetical protein